MGKNTVVSVVQMVQHHAIYQKKFFEVIDMSNMFDNYPEISNENPQVNNPAVESIESVRKLEKRMKKNNQLTRRLIELHELNMKQEQQTFKRENTFFNKIEDSITKALPSILVTIIPMIFTAMFGKKNK